MRALAVVAAWLLSWGSAGSAARAESIDTSIRHMTAASYKLRLAAALALSKSRDPRAVIALADALNRDEEPNIRRVAVIALGKMIDAQTADDARSLGLAAIDSAVRDKDIEVRTTAARVQQELAGLRRTRRDPRSDRGTKPGVFVNIDAATDQSKLAPLDTGDRLARIVRKGVERTGYATSWPGGLPTQTDLASNHSRAFIVAPTVKTIELTKGGRQTQVSCKVEIRVAPWSGTDGGETWEANKAASATGSAKAMTGNSDREIAGGMRDCLEAVAEDVTTRQIVPFLKRLAGS